MVDLRAEHAAQLRAARSHHGRGAAPCRRRRRRRGDGAGRDSRGPARRAGRTACSWPLIRPVASRPGRWPCSSGCARRSLEELGVDPAPETRAVHRALLTETSLSETAGGVPGRARASIAPAWRAGPPRWVGSPPPGPRPPPGGPRCSWSPARVVSARPGWPAELAPTVEATGGRVLTARCYAGERSLFLQPLVDALDSAVAALPAARLRAAGRAARRRAHRPVPELADAARRGPPSTAPRRSRSGGRIRGRHRGPARAGRRRGRPCCCSTTCTRPA